MKYAFRCKRCGRLAHGGHAGDNDLPHACVVCNGGVSFDPVTGLKVFDRENWEVLADCTPPRLKELGLTSADVEKYVPASPSSPEGERKHVYVTATEGVKLKDKV